MPRVAQYGVDRSLGADHPNVAVYPKYDSEARADIALVASALFLQRFSLGGSGISFDMVAVILILFYQFAHGKSVIQYDRFLWFLVLGLATTSSLLLNFKSTRLPSYGVFLVFYFLFTFQHPSTLNRYRRTLQGFQFLVVLLSCLAIAQFLAQFAMDGRQIIRFFGIIPDFFLPPTAAEGGFVNTIIPVYQGSSLIKSNGIFLVEPSMMSGMAALGILIEVLEFRRPRYLMLLVLGLLLSYSGTGITILLLCLPLAGLVQTRAQLPALLVAFLALTLVGTGIINVSVFTSRVGEFEDVHASGFERFISSFWMVAEHFNTGSLQAWIRGNGPATMKEFVPVTNYSAFGGTWFKMLYEYGLIGTFIFTCFLGSCLRGSRCPKPLIVALIYLYLFVANNLLGTPTLTIMIVLCTLSGPQPSGSNLTLGTHV